MSLGNEKLRQIHITISGRVQGVGFRAALKRKAVALGICGWVANCENGSVECVVQLRDDVFEEFNEFLNSGPVLARVSSVEIAEQVNEVPFREFIVSK